MNHHFFHLPANKTPKNMGWFGQTKLSAIKSKSGVNVVNQVMKILLIHRPKAVLTAMTIIMFCLEKAIIKIQTVQKLSFPVSHREYKI